MRVYFVLFLSILSVYVLAQTGEIEFYVSPAGALVKINDQVLDLQKDNRLELLPGDYPLEVWAPKMEVVQDTVSVVSGKTTRYRKGLTRQAPAFIAHRKALNAYRIKKMFRLTPVILGTLMTGTGAYIVATADKSSAEDRLQALEGIVREFPAFTDREQYDMISLDYDVAKAKYEEERDAYNRRIGIGIPVTIGIGGLTLFVHLMNNKAEKRPKVEYKEQSPFARVFQSAQPVYVTVAGSPTYGFRIDF